MKKIYLSLFFVGLINLVGCKTVLDKEMDFIQANTDYASEQMQLMLKQVGKADKNKYPRTIGNDNKFRVTSSGDWTPGFFPGTLWYLYELTDNEEWKNHAEEWTYPLEEKKNMTSNHDIGFMMYCSYGNAQRLAPKDNYNDILVQSAKSLCTRYNDTTKAIKSWNYFKAWDGKESSYPVIIDNMMNLELLCYASSVTDNSKYRDIAIKHANTTLKNHFREDYSSYHVVGYDINTGKVTNRQTAQGYSDNSTWSRGQAWAIYGYTMMYRETKKAEYLEAAKKLTAYFTNHLPEDLIPLWDFNVGQDGYTPGEKSNAKNYMDRATAPRDASAGAIVCSALFELGELSKDKHYTDVAIKMLKSLASPDYRAKIGENADFMIMHCTGSIPHNSEIDKPLVYADYYFIEALTRYKRLLETGSVYYKK